MRKLLITLPAVLFASCFTPSSLEEVKEFYTNVLTSDSITNLKAVESGALEKIINAKTQNEAYYHYQDFRKFSKQWDSLHGIKDGKIIDSVKYFGNSVKQ